LRTGHWRLAAVRTKAWSCLMFGGTVQLNEGSQPGLLKQILGCWSRSWGLEEGGQGGTRWEEEERDWRPTSISTLISINHAIWLIGVSIHFAPDSQLQSPRLLEKET
jgi:hypothetical protein